MVERFGNKYFGGATYDFKCPFDIAMKIKDECEHRGKDVTWVRDILDWEMPENAYTEFGKEIVEAFNLLTNYGFATNKGVPQKDIDFQIRYYDYLVKNGVDTNILWNKLFKTYCNNKNIRDFSKFADLEMFKERDSHIIAQLKHRDKEVSWRKLQREYNETYVKRVKDGEKVD